MAKSLETGKLENIELEKGGKPCDSTKAPNLNGDWSNFFLLVLMYTMQGALLGLTISFPIIFQSNKLVTYEDQVNFNLSIS